MSSIFDPHQREMHERAEATRRIAVSSRMGVVKEVKQEGGERKIRAVIGVDPDGKELLSPWLNTTEQRGATRSQTQYKPGQNIRLSAVDGDYRQATVTPWAEGTSFPPPDNSKDHGYGDSYQAGKVHQGVWMPEDKDDQKGGQQDGGQQSQQDGKQGQQNHRHETWIATDENKPPKHSGRSREEEVSGDASGGDKEQDQQQPEQKKPSAAMMVSLDEKGGYTARVGTDVRVAAHSDGAKVRAGETYFVAQKDKDALLRAKDTVYVDGKKGNYVSEPWVIGEAPEDKIPNDDKLGNK